MNDTGPQPDRWLDSIQSLIYRYPEPFALFHSFVDLLMLYAAEPVGLEIAAAGERISVCEAGTDEVVGSIRWGDIEATYRPPVGSSDVSPELAPRIDAFSRAIATHSGSALEAVTASFRTALPRFDEQAVEDSLPPACPRCPVDTHDDHEYWLRPFMDDVEFFLGEFRSTRNPLWVQVSGEFVPLPVFHFTYVSDGAAYVRALLSAGQRTFVEAAADSGGDTTFLRRLQQPVRCPSANRYQASFSGFRRSVLPHGAEETDRGSALELDRSFSSLLDQDGAQAVLQIPLHVESVPWASINLPVPWSQRAHAAYFCYRDVIPRLFANLRDAALGRYWEILMQQFDAALSNRSDLTSLHASWHAASCVLPFASLSLSSSLPAQHRPELRLGAREFSFDWGTNPHYSRSTGSGDDRLVTSYGSRRKPLSDLVTSAMTTFERGTRIQTLASQMQAYLASSHTDSRRLSEFQGRLNEVLKALPGNLTDDARALQLITRALRGGHLTRQGLAESLNLGQPSRTWLDSGKFWDDEPEAALYVDAHLFRDFQGTNWRYDQAGGQSLLSIQGLESVTGAQVMPWHELDGATPHKRVRPHRDIYHWILWEILYNAARHSIGSSERKVVVRLDGRRVELDDCSSNALIVSNLCLSSTAERGSLQPSADWAEVPSPQAVGGLLLVPRVIEQLRMGAVRYSLLETPQVAESGEPIMAMSMGLFLEGLVLGGDAK